MSAPEPITVQIAALGGQGGGVLADWMAEAAGIGGHPAQATSIPGVAQRTGATTYYIEMSPHREPAPAPLFGLYPDEDGVDLLVALEPLEAARALSLGFVTERTVVVTGEARIYATSEKMVAGDGAVPVDDLIDPLRAAARQVIVVGPEGGNETPSNAVFLGAVAASGRLPLEAGAYRKAIAGKGVAVDANLAAFEAGLNAVGGGSAPDDGMTYDPPPSDLASAPDRYPEALRPLIGHALARLADYQDMAYARRYLDRLDRVVAAAPESHALIGEVARRLAARMSYEDVIRVAQLKTRPGRLARIRGELGLAADAPLTVTDFLKPGREEVASLLPPGLGQRVMAGGGAAAGASGRPIRLDISSLRGQAMMRGLAALRPWRPKTYRYAEEQAAIEAWLAAVAETAAVDAELARDLAELAMLARGYGRVRSRGETRLAQLLADWTNRLHGDRPALLREVKALLHQARHDPDAPCRSDDTLQAAE